MTWRINDEMPAPPAGSASFAGHHDAATELQLPAFLREPFAAAMSQSTLLPAFIALFGVVAALFMVDIATSIFIEVPPVFDDADSDDTEGVTELLPVIDEQMLADDRLAAELVSLAFADDGDLGDLGDVGDFDSWDDSWEDPEPVALDPPATSEAPPPAPPAPPPAPPAPPPVPAPDVAPGQPVWDLGPDTDELVRPHDDPLFSPGAGAGHPGAVVTPAVTPTDHSAPLSRTAPRC